MTRFSINNIFNNKSCGGHHGYKPVSIKSLRNNVLDPPVNNYNFDIKSLISHRKNKKKKIKKTYNQILNSCLRKIELANQVDELCLLFEIPPIVTNCNGYNIFDCKYYLKRKLKKYNFNTVFVDNDKIFVSWIEIFD